MAINKQYSYEEAVTAMTNAHNAGDFDSAKKIADYIKQNDLQPAEEPSDIVKMDGAEKKSSNYAIDKIKSGAADFVFSVLSENDQVLGLALGLDDKDYFREDGTYDRKRYERDKQAAIENAKEEFFGYDGIKPASEVERYLGTALESVVAEGPLAFVGGRGLFGAAKELLHSYAASLLGQVGAETGAMTARALGGGETAQTLAAGVGGLAGSTITIPGRVALGAGVEVVSRAASERKRINQSVDSATDYVAGSEIKQLIDKATKIQPEIDDVLKATVDLQDEIPGLIVPPVAALAENPIYRKNTEYLLRTSPEFYASAKKSLSDAKSAIDARKEALFGQSGPAADAQLKARLPQNYEKDIRSAKKRISAIDDEISKITQSIRMSPNYRDVGERAKFLMTAKEAGIKKKLSPKYKKLFSDAESAGIEFPARSVAAVHQMYKSLRSEDVFASFPSLSNKLNNLWSPKQVDPSPIIIPGMPQPKSRMEYQSVPLSEMDSFKRALNKALRSTKDESTKRILTNLKKSLDSEITKMPDEFSQSYKDLDLEFYRELGIPRSKAEISQLDSARFSSSAGKYLSKPEQASEFLAFVGDAGIPVVRDAIFMNMQGGGLVGGGVFTDGLVDPRKLSSFINQNMPLINSVPGLRDELTNASRLVDGLVSTKARLDAEYNIKAKELGEGFYDAYHKKGLETVASEILSSRLDSQKYLKDIKNFEPDTAKMAKQAVRATLLEKAMNSSSSTIDFVNKNSRAFSDWFGPTYAKDVQSIAEASDIISKIDVDKMKFAIDYSGQDLLLEKIGISSTQLQSVARDRISNGLTKLAIIGSKISTSSVAAKRDSKVMELLLNPEALGVIRKSVESKKSKILDEKTLSKIGMAINNSVYRGLYFGATGVEEALKEEVGLELQPGVSSAALLTPVAPMLTQESNPN